MRVIYCAYRGTKIKPKRQYRQQKTTAECAGRNALLESEDCRTYRSRVVKQKQPKKSHEIDIAYQTDVTEKDVQN